jgi:hypothetical protein
MHDFVRRGFTMVFGLETIKQMNADKCREHHERDCKPTGQPPKRLTIAIDYDDTFTSDPVSWMHVIQILEYWHRVICVSSRKNTLENMNTLRSELHDAVTVVLAYDKPKRLAAKEAGFDVDIWIDDRPETIATKEECLALVG